MISGTEVFDPAFTIPDSLGHSRTGAVSVNASSILPQIVAGASAFLP
jgi:hypothetical protein